MGDGEIVYASERHLFVATNQWSNVRGDTVEPSPRTLIHEFDITDPRRAAYRVSGEVRGTVLNQFSMSEYGGHLRVATTEQDPNGRGTGESRVFVLKDNGQTLGTVGDVGGLGRGERIYAVRFIGDVGYVVTFRQVDPLYTLDLSNPSRPRVVGELKILGYSAYLHPIGPDLLLGVGQDATPEGRTRGTQVSVFDVSDPASPRLLHQRSLGQGQSPAEFDHASLSARGHYAYATGTSYAAPQVAGAAALVWAANPSLTADQVVALLERSASGGGAWNSGTGFGVLDVASAVAAALGVAPPQTRSIDAPSARKRSSIFS